MMVEDVVLPAGVRSGKCGGIMMQLTVAIRLLVVNTISMNLHQSSSYSVYSWHVVSKMSKD